MLTISEVAKRTGVAPSALRYYERQGLLRPADRAGGKRVYDDGIIEQLALIDLLQQSGLTIAEIAAVIDADGHVDAGWRDVARRRLIEVDAQLERLARAKLMLEHTLMCRHRSLDTCPVFHESVRVHAATIERGRQP